MHTAHLHYQDIITSRVKIISESLLFPIFLYLWNLPKYISFKIVVHFGPGESSSDDAVMMNTPVVKAALEMGFSRSLVKRTVQSCLGAFAHAIPCSWNDLPREFCRFA